MRKSKRKSISVVVIILLIVLVCLINLICKIHTDTYKLSTEENCTELENSVENFENGNDQNEQGSIIEQTNNENEIPSEGAQNTSEFTSEINNSQSENNTAENDALDQNSSNLPTGNTKYYIKVNYQANAVTIYQKDSEGYYTVPVKAMICSCGAATPTSGVYKTSQGYDWGLLEGGTYGRYSTRIVGGILFHSVPYTRMYEDDSLEYWEFDKLGTTASLGCVRLQVSDCKWIFDNVEVGTQVEFYADSNPGPLGKPTAQKISENEECRNWDPTDTSPSSPWNK